MENVHFIKKKSIALSLNILGSLLKNDHKSLSQKKGSIAF